jgi:hypothetical protein
LLCLPPFDLTDRSETFQQTTVLPQDEWAGAAFRSQYNVGENVGVKKHVMRAKLARVCSGTPYSAQLPGSAYDQLDPPGTNKEWNSPQIQVHDTRLYITHVESVSEDPSVSSLRQ